MAWAPRLGAAAASTCRARSQSVTGDTLTITTANGQTLEFTLGAQTTYDTKAPATAADVKPGSKVEVQLQLGAGANGFRGNASARAVRTGRHRRQRHGRPVGKA